MSAAGPFVLAKALDWLAEGRRVALATVIQTWGSAPQPIGSQLVIDAEGNFLGSVSGGCVEAEIITEAAEVIATAGPRRSNSASRTTRPGASGSLAAARSAFSSSRLRHAAPPPTGVLPRLVDDVAARRQVALVTHLATARGALPMRPTISARASPRRLRMRFAATKAWRWRGATAKSSSTCSTRRSA